MTRPILTGRSQFSWAHYRALLQVEDKAQRQQIEAQAARNGWTSVELEDRLKSIWNHETGEMTRKRTCSLCSVDHALGERWQRRSGPFPCQAFVCFVCFVVYSTAVFRLNIIALSSPTGAHSCGR
jgi:hypothetical protein